MWENMSLSFWFIIGGIIYNVNGWGTYNDVDVCYTGCNQYHGSQIECENTNGCDWYGYWDACETSTKYLPGVDIMFVLDVSKKFEVPYHKLYEDTIQNIIDYGAITNDLRCSIVGMF